MFHTWSIALIALLEIGQKAYYTALLWRLSRDWLQLREY
ncbi:protein of unknown function [Candidatus Promineifilum breve]|uniref:Uncharacterized protein n=1 Tax=Candidatus Promineifilum breve TaxID=1806508 RepID=A0A160T079_9CHLR|nr:protein of unknown function [Candidatus Promineifilum breve]